MSTPANSNIPLSINQLPVSVEIPQDANLYEIVSLLYKRIARAVNTKEGSIYDLIEQGNFEQFFTPSVLVANPGIPFKYRQGYRFTFDMVQKNGGNIAPGATVTTPHGIVGLKFTTLLYCSCTSVANEFFTVVYPQCQATNVNVSVTNPTANFLSSAILVFEYLKE